MVVEEGYSSDSSLELPIQGKCMHDNYFTVKLTKQILQLKKDPTLHLCTITRWILSVNTD